MQKNVDPKIFFIRATPLKNGNFSKQIFLHLLILKIFTLSKFHSPMCWNGWNFRKNREKPIFLTLDHMGTPLKNQNFENRASTCFKLAQIRPRAKISWAWDFWCLRKTRTHRHTDRQDSCFISIDLLFYAHDVILWRHQITKNQKSVMTSHNLSYGSDHKNSFFPEIHSPRRSFWGIDHPIRFRNKKDIYKSVFW